MTTLHELAAMLDAATGPSREIDGSIARAFKLFPAHCLDGPEFCGDAAAWAGGGEWWIAPRYSSSIDAALALVERMLPGAITVHAQQWKHPAAERPESWTWELSNYPRGRTTATYSPTAPLAILKALVAALIAQEKTND